MIKILKCKETLSQELASAVFVTVSVLFVTTSAVFVTGVVGREVVPGRASAGSNLSQPRGSAGDLDLFQVQSHCEYPATGLSKDNRMVGRLCIDAARLRQENNIAAAAQA